MTPRTIEQMLPRLKAFWFKIAIDDFGSGYFSLGQLRQLPADVLKKLTAACMPRS